MEQICSIRYKTEEHGDLRQLLLLLTKKNNNTNAYYGRNMNDVLRMLIIDGFKKEAKNGTLKSFVEYISEEKGVEPQEALRLVLTEPIDTELANDWLKRL